MSKTPPDKLNPIGVIVCLIIAGAIAYALAGAARSPTSPTRPADRCESLWQQNEAMASRPEYADNGHAHYLEVCHDGEDLRSDLRKEGVIK